jgi:Holliday junction resolvasome RuvABC endonuclease subunit
MAPTTLTMPAAHASRTPIAVPPTINLAHHAVLALDLGTTTGWALRSRDGGITSGTITFKPSRFEGGGMRFLRFRTWLAEVMALSGGVSRVVFEEVRAHAGTDAAHIYGGFLAHLSAWSEERGIPYQGVPVGTIKAFATGKGNANKATMTAAIRARGFRPADDNEADAIALLLWATDAQGGRA